MSTVNLGLDLPFSGRSRSRRSQAPWRRWTRALAPVRSGAWLFVVIGIVVAVTDLVFVVIDYRFDHRSLDQEWRSYQDRTLAAYDLALREEFDKMVMLARFIAGDEEVSRLFDLGRQAVESEGGGPGRAAAHHARIRLYQRLAPAWHRISNDYGIRQVHFHLGPGALSFLRVHQPDRYGDRMDDLRHIIVDTNANGLPRWGFETGRIYSGLRGVVPVTVDDEDGESRHVGVVEVGTSFGQMISRLDDVFDAGVAVILRRDHIEDATWREFAPEPPAAGSESCDCIVEAHSRPGIFTLLESGDLGPILAEDKPYLVVRQGSRSHLVVRQPLRDYLGMHDPDRPAVGQVVVWHDVTDRMADFRHDQALSVVYALLALLLIEACVFLAMRFVLRAKQATEKASRAKSCFLATMSHELRTPLNAVIGFSDLLAQEAIGPVNTQQRDYLGSIQGAGSQLLCVVDDVLEYADLEDGAFVPELEPVDAGRQFDNAVAASRSLADGRGVTLTAETPGSVVIRAEPRTFRRALDRLLIHAIAGTPAGGGVAAALTMASREIVITVTDGSPSLSAADVDLLLHPMDHAGDAYHGGLGEGGLRLALVKAFVETHGGALDIKPVDVTGNTFRLSLPARRSSSR